MELVEGGNRTNLTPSPSKNAHAMTMQRTYRLGSHSPPQIKVKGSPTANNVAVSLVLSSPSGHVSPAVPVIRSVLSPSPLASLSSPPSHPASA